MHIKNLFLEKKNRLFLLLLLSVFFVGVSGRILLEEPKRETVSVTLTVRTAPEDALLLSHLPKETEGATLDGIPVTAVALSLHPALRNRFLPEGGVSRYESRLFSEAELTVRLEGEERDGRLFAEGLYFPIGKSAVLETRDFMLSVRITEIKMG